MPVQTLNNVAAHADTLGGAVDAQLIHELADKMSAVEADHGDVTWLAINVNEDSYWDTATAIAIYSK